MGPILGSSRLSIFLRTFGGFAVLLFLCAVLAMTSVIGMRIVDSSVEDSRQSSGAAISALELAGHVAKLNAEVSRFALTGTAADEDGARRQLAVTAEAFGKIVRTGLAEPVIADNSRRLPALRGRDRGDVRHRPRSLQVGRQG